MSPSKPVRETPSGHPGPGRRGRPRREETRPRLLAAAEKLFSSRRFHEITLDDVAREAGVGKGTIYLYFQGKDDLFVQTETAGFEELCRILEGLREKSLGCRELLVEAARRMTRFFERRHRVFRLVEGERQRLFHGGFRTRIKEHRNQLHGVLLAILERCRAEGVVGVRDPAPVQVQYLMALLHARLHAAREEEAGGAGMELDAVVAFFLRGCADDGAGRDAGRGTKTSRTNS